MSDEQCREALRSLPPDLPETYMRILKRVPDAQRSYVQITLNLIAYADPKLSIAQCREVLSVPSNGSLLKASGLIRKDAITRHCSSLIRRSNDGKYLEFAHFSVQEFLTSDVLKSSEFPMFTISISKCNRLLATRCLEYLQLENFNRLPTPTDEHLSDIEKTTQNHPLYSYAATNWMYYSREEWEDPAMLASAKCLFDPRKTPCFTYWVVVLVLEMTSWARKLENDEKVDLIAEIVDNDFHPLLFAATLSLPEISSFLLAKIECQSQEALIERAFECSVDCLYGSPKLFRDEAPEIPERVQRWMGTDASETHYTLQTIRIFVQKLGGTPKSLVGLAASCWTWTFDFSVVELLVTEGTALAQSDLDYISEQLQMLLDVVGGDLISSRTMRSLCLFCESLSGIIDTSPLHLELCRILWRFSLLLADDKENIKTYDIDPRISEDRLSLEKLAQWACHEISVSSLRTAAGDTRVDLSSIIDRSTGDTLLHNLVLGDHEE